MSKTPKRWRAIKPPAKQGTITLKQAQAAFLKGTLSQAGYHDVLRKEQARTEATVFGLWSDYPSMPRKINNLLKPYGLKLKVKRNREWGDQVEVSVETLGSLGKDYPSLPRHVGKH